MLELSSEGGWRAQHLCVQMLISPSPSVNTTSHGVSHPAGPPLYSGEESYNRLDKKAEGSDGKGFLPFSSRILEEENCDMAGLATFSGCRKREHRMASSEGPWY